jgi:hypothetical protein
METIKLMPLAILVLFGAILINGARHSRGGELRQMLTTADRERRVVELTRRLAQRPAAVLSVRRRGINQRFLIDLGDEEVDIRCYWPPGKPIAQLLDVRFRNNVGWIIDVDGPAGPDRVYAWLLDVRATSR